jgi:hypothetical protein
MFEKCRDAKGNAAPRNHNDASVNQFLYFRYHKHEDVSRKIVYQATLPVYCEEVSVLNRVATYCVSGLAV